MKIFIIPVQDDDEDKVCALLDAYDITHEVFDEKHLSLMVDDEKRTALIVHEREKQPDGVA